MIIPDYIERHTVLNPEKKSLIFEDRQCTYMELQQRVYRLANSLIKHGLKEGDRVAVLAENCFEYLEIYLGVAKAGGVMAPLNYRLTPNDISHLIRYLEAKFLILGFNYLDMINSIKDEIIGVKYFITVEGSGDGMIHYDQFLDESLPVDPKIQRGMDDLFCIIFTGGTTGRPKGAMLTYRNLYNWVIAEIIVNKPIYGDVHLRFTPLFHAAGLWSLFTQFVLGNTQVLLRKFDMASIVEAIEKWNVTYLSWNSSITSRFLEYPDIANKRKNTSSLRVINIGGAPIAPKLIRRLLDTVGCTVNFIGGQTEAGIFSGIKCNDYIHSHLEKLESTGRPVVNIELKIVDENDEGVPPGIVGELVVRGESLMAGYWNMPEETAISMRGGWFHTGDLCKLDEDGFLYYIDRIKDMIKSGGENVYSKEVEEVLYDHPDIFEAAIIGAPDEKWGELVKAFVVLKSGSQTTEKDVITFCKTRLAGFKCPKSVIFLDGLPKTVIGKKDKQALKMQYR